jgi:hypothetical protein
MATINIISTSYPVNDTINTVNQLPFTFTDTIRVGYPISFAFNLTYLNQLRQNLGVSTISSSDINNNQYSLQVFLFNSVDGSNNLVNITTNVLYSLSSANLSNNILSQNLYGSNKSFTMCHEDLCDIMTQTEVMQLSKEYNILFRLTLTASPDTSTSVKNGDILHSIKLCLNEKETGPYTPTFDNIDIISFDDFNQNEISNIYTNNPTLIGNNNFQCYYPSNISNLSSLPFILFVHGQNHNSSMYTAYMNHLASYGYFVGSVQRELGYIGFGVDIYKQTRCACIISHLKTYTNKIKNGIFFNKINFSKIILVGHSVGGGDIGTFTANNLYNPPITPSIPDFSFTRDIAGCIFFEPSGFPSPNLINGPVIFVNGILEGSQYGGCHNLGMFNHLNVGLGLRGETYSDAAIVFNMAGHEDIAEPFSAANAGTILPAITYDNTERYAHLDNPLIPKNNKGNQLINCAGEIVKILSQNFYGKINSLFLNTNNRYKTLTNQKNDYTTTNFFRKPVPSLTFLDNLSNTTKFTFTGSTSDFISPPSSSYVSPWALGQGYKAYMDSSRGATFFQTFNPQYWSNGVFVFPHTQSTTGLNYTLATSLNLNGNCYLGVAMGIVYTTTKSVINNLSGKMSLSSIPHQNYTLELIDSTGRTSWVSTKQNNIGLRNPPGIGSYNVTSKEGLCDEDMSLPASYFKVSDFKMINPNVDISSITNINIKIGDNYGLSGPINGWLAYNGLFVC